MASWKCDGVPKDGKQYSNQNPPGKHEPYENYGSDCVICGLPREAITGGGKSPAKAIAAIITGAFAIAAIGGSYLLFKPCPQGQQKINGSCIAVSPSPTFPSTPTSTPSTVKPMNTLKKSQTPEANLKKSPPSPSAGSPVPEAKTFPSNKPSQYLEKAPQVITPAPRRAESRGNNRSNRIEPQPLEDLTPEPAQPHIDLPGETGDPIGFPGVR